MELSPLPESLYMASFNVMMGLQSSSGKNLIPDPKDLSSLFLLTSVPLILGTGIFFMVRIERSDMICWAALFSSSSPSTLLPPPFLPLPPCLLPQCFSSRRSLVKVLSAAGHIPDSDDEVEPELFPNTDQPDGQNWAPRSSELIFFPLSVCF